MSRTRTALFTALAMIAFASNSLLCRIALQHTAIDAATFTSIRVISGAVMLLSVASIRGVARRGSGTWVSAGALVVYAAGFSFAYVTLPAGIGALLLFGAVQLTMIGRGVWMGERLRPPQIAGFVLALTGLAVLLQPGASAPPLAGSALMLAAGVAWGIYSLRGRGVGHPTAATSGNFLRAVPLALALSLATRSGFALDRTGALCAIASGAVTSGIGYALWYAALPSLSATTAASIQLCVPLLAALGGVALLGEHVSARLGIAALAILGGIALVIARQASLAPRESR